MRVYTVQLGLYQIYRAMRRVMALRGYVYAHPDELEGGFSLSRLISVVGLGSPTRLVHGPEAIGYDAEKSYYRVHHYHDREFPHVKGVFFSDELRRAARQALGLEDYAWATGPLEAVVNSGVFPQGWQCPWVYPRTSLEPDHTYNGPYPNGSLPSMFIEHASLSTEKYEAFLEARNVSDLRMASAAAAQRPTSCLGNAVDLSVQLIKDAVRWGVVPDFNLDSDRGYGWLQWRAPISPGVGTLDENLPDRGIKVGEEVTVSAAGRRRWPDEKEKPLA